MTMDVTWGHSEHTDAISEALVALWADPKLSNPHAAATGNVPGKDGRTGYSYRYAQLGTILSDLRPVMAGHGLALVQMPSGGNRVVTVTSVLLHTSGQRLWCTCTLDAGAGPQAQGGSITYARRYSILSLLGLFNDDEDDGGAAAQTAVQASHRSDRGQQARASRQQQPAQQRATTTRGRAPDAPTQPADGGALDASWWTNNGWTDQTEHDRQLAAVTVAIRDREADVPGYRDAVATQVWRAQGLRTPLPRAVMDAYADAVDRLWEDVYADQAPFSDNTPAGP